LNLEKFDVGNVDNEGSDGVLEWIISVEELLVRTVEMAFGFPI